MRRYKMKVEKELHVTGKEFFDEIAIAVMADYKRNTNKTIHVSQIKPGLKYKKKMKGRGLRQNDVAIKVINFISNQLYSVRFTSDVDTTCFSINGLINCLTASALSDAFKHGSIKSEVK